MPEHPNLVGLYCLKDEVRARRTIGGKCEFCQLRIGEVLHHRTYARFGCERPEDVMLVCGLCHRLIHGLAGFGRTVLCRQGSLLDLGDRGTGDTEQWKAYLVAAAARDAALPQPQIMTPEQLAAEMVRSDAVLAEVFAAFAKGKDVGG